MTKDGDAGVCFYATDQLVGAARYDKIDVFVEVKE